MDTTRTSSVGAGRMIGEEVEKREGVELNRRIKRKEIEELRGMVKKLSPKELEEG